MSRALPFPKYSWQISQHEVAFNYSDVSAMLASAQMFEGQKRSKYNAPLNNFLVKKRILTDNIRNGVASPWRDYQQVLAELGLIVSSKLSDLMTITPIGQSFLAGNLSFSKMLTIQLLRYQYPNGQKDKIDKKDSLEILIENEISIRPALILLKLLLELKSHSIDELSVDEILEFVLPNRIDAEWEVSISEILNSKGTVRSKNSHARRNVMAWIRLLGKTDIFHASNGASALRLSDFSTKNLKNIGEIADRLISADLWTPKDASKLTKLSWFNYFGSISSFSVEDEILISADSDVVYAQNQEIVEDETGYFSEINLEKYVPIDTKVVFESKLSGADLLESIQGGQIKVAFAKSEHNKIVNRIAEYFVGKGYDVFHDLKSVDLVVKSPSGDAQIFEVKTVNPYNIDRQIRTAFGQVLEYDYRLKNVGENVTARNIVINRAIKSSDWKVDFCGSYSVDLIDSSEFI